MNNIVSISILILSISVAVMVTGIVVYLFDLDELFRKIYRRIEAGTKKRQDAEFERGRLKGRKEFAAEIDRMLDVYLFDSKTVYTYQIKETLEKKIAEEVRK